ncbi:SH3 domain-containing protein [Luteimonas salinilitoris]|uniref:SH3 domain-containing protein n=1 Tax=Luteimonas salinilitoris TaxID=3237697 RepID=A0ABV4HWP8_9GAMM
MARGASKSRGSSWGAVVILVFLAWMLGHCSGGADDPPRSSYESPSHQPAVEKSSVSALPEPIREDELDARELRYIDASSLNLRGSPNGTVIGRLPRGQKVSVEERKGTWLRVSLGGAPTGWIAERYTCAPLGCWQRSVPTSVRPARSVPQSFGSSCPCSGSTNCYGPRGGRYCITSGGNKRYR